jgi:hypothetical protein
MQMLYAQQVVTTGRDDLINIPGKFTLLFTQVYK